jgi:tRNA dimethylallyltransferase
MEKIVVILGPTASGKSRLGIRLARKFKGEIISADSRQVYQGMDLGTGKVSKAEQRMVPHHLLDVASPKRQFTASQYKKLAKKAVKEISARGRFPFLVGGTAFYVYALVDDLELPDAKPDLKLRKALDKKTTEQLFAMLKKLDPARAKNIDANNRRRLVRAIEINKVTGKTVPSLEIAPSKATLAYDALLIGVSKPQEELYKLIDKRLQLRLRQGMVKEVKRLVSQGISHKKLESFGLEYRYVSQYLQGKLSYDQMVIELSNAIHRFSKRQMTWFKRDHRIHWVSSQAESEKLVKKFLNA